MVPFVTSRGGGGEKKIGWVSDQPYTTINDDLLYIPNIPAYGAYRLSTTNMHSALVSFYEWVK
jgi:hypothetical protein